MENLYTTPNSNLVFNSNQNQDSLKETILSVLKEVQAGKISAKSKKISKDQNSKIIPGNKNFKQYLRNYDKIISISATREIPQDPTSKRFAVDIKYGTAGISGDPRGFKEHIKTVKFGTKGEKEFFEDGDAFKRNKKVSRMGDSSSILYPKFWEEFYLNHKSGSLQTAFMEILSSHGIKM